MNPIPKFTKPSPSSSSSFQNLAGHSHSPLRIADILNAGTDDHQALMGRSNNCPDSINCSSPRSIMPRWISGLRRCRRKRGKVDKNMPDRPAQASCSTNCLNEKETGQSSKNESSFNLGVGCCLLHLIAASKNELDKMIDMRMQMEALLQNTREDLLKKDELCKEAETNGLFAYSASTDVTDSPGYDTSVLAESSRITVGDQSLKWEAPEIEEGMDELEAELEVELERMQLHLDGDMQLKHPEEMNVKVTDDEYTSSSKSQTMSSSEVIHPPPDDTYEDYSVSPNELERKLHILLEARQQEQIAELEAALERLKHKLYEKEMEVSWWKDTARFVSRNAIEPTRFTSENNPKTSTLAGQPVCNKDCED
ncbi:protein POLAR LOCALIZATION DURING ASYMMETRIC DIVISION AND REDISTRIBUTION-like [Mercurialis annua]|uniref:protein POLAR LOCALIZATION DURING ASYMMETRIC DIVISION AND REDISTRIBUTION-like n=1 Tax=Mercurialis annua TaxID=3986 RepID=UPI0021609615|nr:protein POLAR LOCALIZATION DURING ASYMMETRIC DIVISION AND REDISTRIBUTION-like [Mercurialis annua]